MCEISVQIRTSFSSQNRHNKKFHLKSGIENGIGFVFYKKNLPLFYRVFTHFYDTFLIKCKKTY